jgi:hypothetical protein
MNLTNRIRYIDIDDLSRIQSLKNGEETTVRHGKEYELDCVYQVRQALDLHVKVIRVHRVAGGYLHVLKKEKPLQLTR